MLQILATGSVGHQPAALTYPGARSKTESTKSGLAFFQKSPDNSLASEGWIRAGLDTGGP